jgi:tripartite-type tricarboxylate transporter receptor subunit TctC
MGSGQQVLVRASPLPGLEVTVRYALYVPAATPPEIVHKLNADTVAVLAEPGIRDKMGQIGVAVVGSTPEELARHLRAETELWGPVIKAANIKSE